MGATYYNGATSVISAPHQAWLCLHRHLPARHQFLCLNAAKLQNYILHGNVTKDTWNSRSHEDVVTFGSNPAFRKSTLGPFGSSLQGLITREISLQNL